MNKREQILNALGDIPPLPASTVRLLSVVNDPETTIGTITTIVKRDQALTANLLRLVNSIYYRSSQPIDSIDKAILRIGIREVTRIATSSSVAPLSSQPVGGYDLEAGDLWSHSLAIAVATEELARLCKMKSPVDCFTAGLLADIGKLVLGRFVGNDIEKIKFFAFEYGISFDQAERQALGIDHAEVGAELLRCWKFPEALIDVVRWHHEPNNAPEHLRESVDIVHAASQLVTTVGIGAGTDGTQYTTNVETVDRMNISHALLEQAIIRTITVNKEMAELYNPNVARKSS